MCLLHFNLSALAFCDFTPLQSMRRDMLHSFVFPHSKNWRKLDEIVIEECDSLCKHLRKLLINKNEIIDIKMVLSLVTN